MKSNSNMEGEGFFSIVIPNGGSQKQKNILIDIRNSTPISKKDVAKLNLWHQLSTRALNKNYKHTKIGNQHYFIRKEEGNPELPQGMPMHKWNNYVNLVEQASGYDAQASPEPERDHEYSTVTTSPLKLIAA